MLAIGLNCHWCKLAKRKMSELLLLFFLLVNFSSSLNYTGLGYDPGHKTRTHVTQARHSLLFQDLFQIHPFYPSHFRAIIHLCQCLSCPYCIERHGFQLLSDNVFSDKWHLVSHTQWICELLLHLLRGLRIMSCPFGNTTFQLSLKCIVLMISMVFRGCYLENVNFAHSISFPLTTNHQVA